MENDTNASVEISEEEESSSSLVYDEMVDGEKSEIEAPIEYVENMKVPGDSSETKSHAAVCMEEIRLKAIKRRLETSKNNFDLQIRN